MITFQETHQKIIFDNWILYFNNPQLKCKDLQKYLLLALQVVKKNFKCGNWFYVKPFGDIFQTILDDYCSKSEKEEDFGFMMTLINNFYNIGAYDPLFLAAMKKRVESKMTLSDNNLNSNIVKEKENNSEINERYLTSEILRQVLVSEYNNDIIK